MRTNQAVGERAPFFEVAELIRRHFETSGIASRVRQYTVLKFRNGLEATPQLTLNEIGIILDVTGQRVAQIEEGAYKTLSKLLQGETPHADPSCGSSFAAVRGQLVEVMGPKMMPLPEEDVVRALGRYFSSVAANMSLLRLILKAHGHEKASLMQGTKHESTVWVSDSADGRNQLEVAGSVFKALQQLVVPAPFHTIKLEVNSERSVNARFTDDEIRVGLRLCPTMEVVEGETYQIAFECLQNVPDRAYRVLHEEGEPLWAREIARLITKRVYETGSRKVTTTAAVGNSLSANSERFKVQGHSLWALKEWDVDTRTVLELMEAALHTSGEPLSAAEIWNYVKARRRASRSSIDWYLQRSQFAEDESGLYGMRDWAPRKHVMFEHEEGRPQKRTRTRLTKRELIQNTVRSLLRKEGSLTLPLRVLRDAIVRELDYPKASVYGAISGMDDVEKHRDPDVGAIACTLVDASRPYEVLVRSS